MNIYHIIKKAFRKKTLSFQQGDVVKLKNGEIIIIDDWRPLDIYHFSGTLLNDSDFYSVGKHGLWNKRPENKNPQVKFFIGKIVIENKKR